MGIPKLLLVFHSTTQANIIVNQHPRSVYNGGSLIQSPYGVNGNVPSDPHNFELVVLENNRSGGRQLVHHWRDNSNINYPWNPKPGQPSVVVGWNATSAGALIYSSYNRLEVLVNEGGIVTHYASIGDEWILQDQLLWSAFLDRLTLLALLPLYKVPMASQGIRETPRLWCHRRDLRGPSSCIGGGTIPPVLSLSGYECCGLDECYLECLSHPEHTCRR